MNTLSSDELDLVRGSFRDLAPTAMETAALFYDRLFAVHPGLRPHFPAELDGQCAKLMSMLGAVVAQLHDLPALRPMLGDLARRHVGYGARPEHYAPVGEALLWTFARRLGEGFTPAHEAAWRKAYAALAAAMLEEAAVPA
jgi:nitric oxide dioxygenase